MGATTPVMSITSSSSATSARMRCGWSRSVPEVGVTRCPICISPSAMTRLISMDSLRVKRPMTRTGSAPREFYGFAIDCEGGRVIRYPRARNKKWTKRQEKCQTTKCNSMGNVLVQDLILVLCVSREEDCEKNWLLIDCRHVYLVGGSNLVVILG